MNKRTFVATLFFVFGASLNLQAADAKNVCEKDIRVTEAKLKKSFDPIWEDVDSTVGVEFFLMVLKGNDRLPASDSESSTVFYTNLLKGIKKTSFELRDHGISLDEKKIKKTEELILALEKAEKCSQVVSKN